MKRLLVHAGLIAALALTPLPCRAADSDADVAAHQGALDLAGAFTNDGFKLRDGYFKGALKAGEAALLQVNLYAGNQYWFAVATAEPKSAVSINLYDEAGKLLKTETYTTAATTAGADGGVNVTEDPYANRNRAAAGYSPSASGPYYVRIAATSGATATFCLIYSYK